MDSFPGGDLEEMPETEEQADDVPHSITFTLVTPSGTWWVRYVSNDLRRWKPNFINYQIGYRTTPLALLLWRILREGVELIIQPHRRIINPNRYQLPDTPRIASDVIPEPNLHGTINY